MMLLLKPYLDAALKLALLADLILLGAWLLIRCERDAK